MSQKKKQEDNKLRCPNCKKIIEPNADFCYECGCFLEPATGRILQYGEVSDQQIENKIRHNDEAWKEYNADPNVKKLEKSLMGAALFVLIGLPFIFMGKVKIGMIILVLAFGYAVYMMIRYHKPTPKEAVSDHCFEQLAIRYIIPSFVSKLMDQVEEYNYDNCIPESIIKESKLVRKQYTHSIKWNYIRGIYHGLPVEVCNYNMIYQDPNSDRENSHDSVPKEPVFTGTWFVCHLDRSFPEDVRIAQENEPWRHLVKTGDTEFDRRFFVQSKSPEFANQLLTEEMKNALYSLNGVNLYLKKDGTLIISQNDGRTLMRFNGIHEPVEQIRQRMTQEAADILKTLDILPLYNLRSI